MHARDASLGAVRTARRVRSAAGASVRVLREAVDPALLQVAVLPGGDHRGSALDRPDFVAGYPDVVVDFVLKQRH